MNPGIYVFPIIWQNQYNIVKFKNKIKLKKQNKQKKQKQKMILYVEMI